MAHIARSLFRQPYAQSGGNPALISAGETDLREELDELFFGHSSGVRHGYPCIIRTMRRDTNDLKIECECKHAVTKEADPDCSYCQGEGYLWDEAWTWTYSTFTGADSGQSNRITYMPPGSLRVDFKVFFFRFDTAIRYGDKVIEAKLDEEGNVVVPLVRESIYQPQTINRYRSDNSRIEYIAVYCREGDAIRLDYP